MVTSGSAPLVAVPWLHPRLLAAATLPPDVREHGGSARRSAELANASR